MLERSFLTIFVQTLVFWLDNRNSARKYFSFVVHNLTKCKNTKKWHNLDLKYQALTIFKNLFYDNLTWNNFGFNKNEFHQNTRISFVQKFISKCQLRCFHINKLYINLNWWIKNIQNCLFLKPKTWHHIYLILASYWLVLY